jgi:hypothetical protein
MKILLCHLSLGRRTARIVNTSVFVAFYFLIDMSIIEAARNPSFVGADFYLYRLTLRRHL